MTEYDINYIQRTADYYRAQGYTSDYEWASHEQTPFQKLNKALSKSRIALITTSMPDSSVAKKLRTVVSIPVTPIPTAMYTDDLSWDKDNTHTDDVASFLPIEQMLRLKQEGVIGELTPNFYCVPTEYSGRNTIEKDAVEILAHCKADNVDLALLVPL
jgi:hypothetical protein